MLTTLSIRDFVLVDSLDIEFGAGLCVLTGETGAGKSILLDALSLAIGARADASQVRGGRDAKACITATFELQDQHTVVQRLIDHDIPLPAGGDPLILRRTITADGRSRAYINDQIVSVGALRIVGEGLIEIEGQFASHGLLNPKNHRDSLDAFGHHGDLENETSAAWELFKKSELLLATARDEINRIAAEGDYLRHVCAELDEFDPQEGEEVVLTESRSLMMNAEKVAEAINQTLEVLTGNEGVQQALAKSQRALERANGKAAGSLTAALEALDRTANETATASDLLIDALKLTDQDPSQLEKVDERLFGLRALARKHNTDVDSLPQLRKEFIAKLERLEDSDRDLSLLEAKTQEAKARYDAAAHKLHDARLLASTILDKAINAELPNLRLDKASFITDVKKLDPRDWSRHGIDQVVFKVTTNPGLPAGPINKIASGGELARLLLALKVALSASNKASTLVFDEVDAGVGGATAASVARRLSRLSDGVQILVVTHSPQVAARGTQHIHIRKSVTKAKKGANTTTTAIELFDEERREEIARMLAGAKITDEARAAAESLIAEMIE